jgi:hypothetical protein
VRAKDGKRTNDIQVDNGPTGILFDGASIWVACSFANTVNKISKTAQ